MATPTIQLTRYSPFFRYRETNVAAETATPTANGPLYSETEPANMISMRGYRGLRIIPFGDTNNDTFTVNLVCIYRIEPYANGSHQFSFTGLTDVAYLSRLYFSVPTCTCGDLTGSAGSPVINTERFCDAIGAISVSAWGTDLETAFNSPGATVHAPGATGASAAEIFVPDVGNATWIRVYFSAQGSGLANAIIALES